MPASDRFFLDTNVVLYALGDDEPKRRIALDLLSRQPVLSTQVLSEASSVMHRKYGIPQAAVVRQLDNIRVLAQSIVPLDMSVVDFGVIDFGVHRFWGQTRLRLGNAAKSSG
jgi:predicted nucleic acid-binding protein